MFAFAAALALSSSVEFKAGLYTYPEIAERLSTTDEKVEVRLPLRRGAALLSLLSYPVKDQRRRVCAALDLDLVPNGNGFILARSAAAVAKNEQRQDAFLADLQRLATAQATAYKQSMAELVRLDLEKMRISDEDRHELVILSYPHMGPWTYFSATNLPLLPRSILWEPLFIASPNLAAPAASAKYWLPLIEKPRLMYKVIREQELHAFTTRPDGSLLVGGAMSMFVVQVDHQDRARAIYLGTKRSVPIPNLGLGRAEADWFSEAISRTEKLLDELPRANEPLKTRPNCMSEALLAWANQTGAEVAMELNPAHEELAERADTLAKAIWHGQWMLDRREGILTLTDSLAFLNPPWQEPVAHLAELSRKTAGREWPSDHFGNLSSLLDLLKGTPSKEEARRNPRKTPQWQSLLEFYQPLFAAADGTEDRERISYVPALYHGVRWHALMDHLGVSYAYSLLPRLQKSKMLAPKEGQALLSTRDMATAARSRFYRYVHATAPEEEPEMIVCIRWSEGPMPGTRVVSLELLDAPEMQELPQGHFRWMFIDTI
jgi:hypothetical protein